jgi:hypothetical protein
MIDGKARPGLAGRVAFVHPRACAGLLMELATPPPADRAPAAPLALVAVHGRVEDLPAAAQCFQDLFGMTRRFVAEDGGLVQLGLAGLLLQLSPVGAGFPKPALTALRFRAHDLPALTRRLGAHGVEVRESAVGVVVAPGPGRGAPVIVEPGR